MMQNDQVCTELGLLGDFCVKGNGVDDFKKETEVSFSESAFELTARIRDWVAATA